MKSQARLLAAAFAFQVSFASVDAMPLPLIELESTPVPRGMPQ